MMTRNHQFGNTSLKVSSLCFGTLTVGPVQKNFQPSQAAELIGQAYELGVNFFDTAELYGTYEPLGLALRKYPELVIASKSYAVTYGEMSQSLETARKQLNRDYVDIFSLHEMTNTASLKGHQGAMDCLLDAKDKGIIRAVGISTHYVAGVRAGATTPGVDVIHPLINKAGIGIRDGTVVDMIAAIQTAREFGKGVYAMKVLAGGHLAREAATAIQFITALGTIDSIAIGIQSTAELKMNLLLLAGEPIPPELIAEVAGIGRSLEIASWCQGCGRCIEKCGFGALVMVDGRPKVNQEQCVCCGYCARVCPEFCLRIV